MPNLSRIPAALCLVILLATVAWADEVTNSVGMKLRLLEAGRYERGERDLASGFYKDHSEFNIEDTRPVHPVVLTRPFYLATTEVTVRQFRDFIEATGYKSAAENNPRGGVGWNPKSPADNPRYLSTFRDDGDFNWRKPGFDQADDHPVTGVSFTDAKAYCAWLSKQEGKTYRLPTEAEWEYAARAGTNTYFSFGDKYRGVIQRHANIGNVELEKAFADRVRRQWLVDVENDPPDRHIFTAPVGSYQANPWGLFDMYGNVWEWCEDRYLDTAYSSYNRPGYQQLRKRAIDPLNMQKWNDAGDWRVIRGGSWFNAPVQCRSSVRGYFEATDAACYLGFRVALDPPEEVRAAARERFERAEAARATLKRLAEQFRERRDGRLTIELNHQRRPLAEEFLAALANLDEPVDLYLHGALTGPQIATIAKTRQLAGLVISGVGPDVSDDDFAQPAAHSELEVLAITGAPNLSDGLLRHLRQHNRLELLQLDAAGITDEGLLTLPELRRLETLQLRGTASQGLALNHFRSSPLTRFSCDHLSDEGARLLAGFTQLQDANVAGSPITGRGLASIARLPHLQTLNLTGCDKLNDADFTVLGTIYWLQSLELGQTAAGDDAASALARLNNLRHLRIGSPQLTDAGVRKLCVIVSLHGLTIAPQAANVTDAGFADLWRLANLRNFAVAAPKVTGSGFATLRELSHLDWMSLEGAGLTDAALKNAAASTSLQRLTVGGWQHSGPAGVTDAGIVQLTRAQKLKQFTLFRRGSQVTEDGINQLRQARTDLNVRIHNP